VVVAILQSQYQIFGFQVVFFYVIIIALIS